MEGAYRRQEAECTDPGSHPSPTEITDERPYVAWYCSEVLETDLPEKYYNRHLTEAQKSVGGDRARPAMYFAS